MERIGRERGLALRLPADYSDRSGRADFMGLPRARRGYRYSYSMAVKAPLYANIELTGKSDSETSSMLQHYPRRDVMFPLFLRTLGTRI